MWQFTSPRHWPLRLHHPRYVACALGPVGSRPTTEAIDLPHAGGPAGSLVGPPVGRDLFSRIVTARARPCGRILSLCSLQMGALVGRGRPATSAGASQRHQGGVASCVVSVSCSPCGGRGAGKRTALGVDWNLLAAIALAMIEMPASPDRRLCLVAVPLIAAARAAGSPQPHHPRHIVPNIVAPYLIIWAAFLAQAILGCVPLSLPASPSPPRVGADAVGTSADSTSVTRMILSPARHHPRPSSPSTLGFFARCSILN